ncbi:8503_t:CDS:2, partial [Gigaspora margarita]
ECSLSTKALTYPLGLENTNTDDNYTIEAQPYFNFENENVIDSYKESASIEQQFHHSILVYQLVENKLNQLAPQPLSFNNLENIRETVYVEHKQSPKQKYGLGIGYAKKALDYAIRADNVDEFINYLE